jgi:hypothetical protein
VAQVAGGHRTGFGARVGGDAGAVAAGECAGTVSVAGADLDAGVGPAGGQACFLVAEDHPKVGLDDVPADDELRIAGVLADNSNRKRRDLCVLQASVDWLSRAGAARGGVGSCLPS